MRLRLLAPTIVDFSCAPGAALRDATGYERFWQERAAQAGELLRGLVPADLAGAREGAAVAVAGVADGPAAGEVAAGSVPATDAPAPGAPAGDTGVPVLAAPAAASAGPPPASAPGGPAAASAGQVADGPAAGPPSLPVLTLDHSRSTGRSNRYRTIGRDSLERPLHVLTWSFAMEHLRPEIEGEAVAALAGWVDGVTCRLYDHDVMLVELTADVGAWFSGRPPGEHEDRADMLQEAAVELGAAVARECHDRYVAPTVRWLREADRDGAVVVAAGDPASYPSGQEPGGVQWVARALVVDPHAGPDAERVMRHWVRDIPRSDTDEAPPADMLVAGDIDHLTRWLNYAYVAPGGEPDPIEAGGRCEDVWTGLRCAQYFYAALEIVDIRLSMVLAEAFVAESRWELNRLKDELALLSGRAQLVLMQFRDSSKYLTRGVRQEMDAILRYWSFAEVVEQPVMVKVEACQQRLSDLSAKQAARSALFTDLILLGIGITSVLGTAVALAEFGRVMASDPNLSTYDMARGEVTGWFAAQPADAILVVSGAVSILLIGVYFYFRRTHDT